MKKITEMTNEELKKTMGFITGIAIVLVITFIIVFFLTINQVREGIKITSNPTFYFLIFLPLILGLNINNILKMKKELANRKK